MNIDPSQEIHLLDYLQVILKRKYLILACLLVTLTTVAISNSVVEPLYQAKARILIDEELLQHELLWAAAGGPFAVFCMPSKEIVKVTNGKVICIR